MNTKDRYSGIQSLAEKLNKYGCHFLCLLSIAEEERYRLGFENPYIDLIEAIRISESKGWLRTSDFYVKSCLDILKYFTGKKWTRDQVDKVPSVVESNMYTECNWYNTRTKMEHFSRRSFDTLDDSVTKKEGYLRYVYVYTCWEN